MEAEQSDTGNIRSLLAAAPIMTHVRHLYQMYLQECIPSFVKCLLGNRLEVKERVPGGGSLTTKGWGEGKRERASIFLACPLLRGITLFSQILGLEPHVAQEKYHTVPPLEVLVNEAIDCAQMACPEINAKALQQLAQNVLSFAEARARILQVNRAEKLISVALGADSWSKVQLARFQWVNGQVGVVSSSLVLISQSGHDTAPSCAHCTTKLK